MLKTLVVTSWNTKLYNEYAHRFWDTFPHDELDLCVVSEDVDAPHVTLHMRAQRPFVQRNSIRPVKGFKWDAVRFSHKVYSIFHCARTLDTDWLIWMDADTVVHSNWSYEDFLSFLPKNVWITYVGRGKGVNPGPNGQMVVKNWPECGFYGMNLNHPVCHEFLKEFERMYEEADNGIFTLEEWHDSYVFGSILFEMKNDFPEVLDYSEELFVQTARTGGGGHPLINSRLGAYIDHMKGDRKFQGKSKKKDLIVDRTEDYWN